MNAGLPTQRSFDISQEKDLIALLREVRHSTLSPEEKDEVRDAVFALSTTKNSILLRGVQEVLSTVGITVSYEHDQAVTTHEVSKEEPADNREQHTRKHTRPSHAIGQIRNRPKFSLPDIASNPDFSKVENQQKSTATSEDVTPPNIELSAKDTDSQPATPRIEENNEPAAVPVSSAETPTQTHLTSAAALARIKEIKQRVNSTVGNPVNLIAKNEVVGKEYMATLLEAMRVASADGDVTAVMNKLEAVYKKVETVLAENDESPVSVDTPPAAPLSEPATPLSTSQPVAQQPVVSRSEDEKEDKLPLSETQNFSRTAASHSQETKKEQFTQPEEDIDPAVSVTDDSSSSESPMSPSSNDVAEALEAADAALKTATKEAQTTNEAVPAQEDVEVSTPPARPASNEASESTITPDSNSSRWSSVAQSVEKGNAVPFKKINSAERPVEHTDRFQSVTAVPSAIEKQRQVLEQFKQQQKEHDSNDPLHAEDVQKGLSMLLLEWELFRKSGLLGTGPKGLEHPLYKKMASLKMNLVISGRFEGATPEVRQSIIDYMNGWRYEHGIVHEMDETFEHYLRRVIHTILSKQK